MITLSEAAERYLADPNHLKSHEKRARSLIIYGKRTGKLLTWENLQEWVSVGTFPNRKHTNCRDVFGAFVRALIRFTNTSGLSDINIPTNDRNKSGAGKVSMKSSAVSELINQYVSYKRSAKALSRSTYYFLKSFNDYCANYYNDESILSNNMIMEWSRKRDSEKPSSYNYRIGAIRAFLKYANKLGQTNFPLPGCLPYEKRTFMPHPFTNEELKMFFERTDNIKRNCTDLLSHKVRKLVLPVFFRLLYCTGIRTCEARGLSCQDVDFENGIINISKSKGQTEHRVVVHDAMLKLLTQYNTAMRILLPNRNAFFPNRYGNYLTERWLANNFNKLWKGISDSKARSYDFRSNYAVKNINSWQYTGPEWFDKFLYLSRSMGHAKLSSTAYYYHLVPIFAEQIKELTEQGLNDMLPNLKDFYNEDE